MKRVFVPPSFLSWLYRDDRVSQYQRAMHAGFGKVSAKELEALKSSLYPGDLSEATWSLAYWYRLNGEYQRALDQLLIRRITKPSVQSVTRHAVVEIDCLLMLGRVDAARAVMSAAMERLGESSELCFSAANVAGAGPEDQPEIDQRRLDWLNKTFVGAGFSPIEIRDPTVSLTIDNISAPAARPHPRSGEAKISVLMPAHNAADTIVTAMDSVLSQTWANLELIVVDDGSSDATWAAIKSVAKRDARVVPLRHAHNSGAYAARNTALRQASGEFVTVQDSDDWTHPEKLALQAITLIDKGLSNLTRQIRIRPCMRVYIKPDGATILTSYASLMMRTKTVLGLGGWDEARMGADGEMWARFLLKDGESTKVLATDTPLTLYRFGETSLTADPFTGLGTLGYGARSQYIAAYNHWHNLEKAKNTPDLVMRTGERRFPIPHICRPGPKQRLDYDILFVSDFSLPGGTTSSNVNMFHAAKRLSLRCTCFHWPRLEFADRPINSKIRQLLHEGLVDHMVAGETIRCKLVIINHPPLLNQVPDSLPDVETRNCVIIVNQTPSTRTEGGREMYRWTQVLQNAHLAFGVAPRLAPLSPVIRRLLRRTNPGAPITELDWTPLIDAPLYRRQASPWDPSRRPIVGRHGRDSPDKWPADRESIRQAYCAEQNMEIRIFGGAQGAKRVLGTIPSNWVVYPFDSMSVQDFLKGLDFFVHYPHEHWIEAFGRAPMEAMATGVPVILPRHFHETFEDAAIYAEPSGVADVIRRLWSNRQAYEAQVHRGFEYVKKVCCSSRFEERIRPFLQVEAQSSSRELVPDHS